MRQSSIAFVGFDVHQESIDIAIDDGGRRGIRGASAATRRRWTKRKEASRGAPRAAVCLRGRSLWLLAVSALKSQGLGCMVVSPSMTQRNKADRVKTDPP